MRRVPNSETGKGIISRELRTTMFPTHFRKSIGRRETYSISTWTKKSFLWKRNDSLNDSFPDLLIYLLLLREKEKKKKKKKKKTKERFRLSGEK